MSVPVNQRSEGKLEVCLRAHDLCCYTIQITSNQNNFPEKYQRSLTDKIVDAARNRLKDFLRKYYRKQGNIGYVSQFDIHGYYPNMNHEMAEQTFKKKLPPEIFKMVVKILRSQYEGDKGYNPGSQLIQIAGISVLDGFDHFVKEQLHVKYYIRYMDDFLMIHHDRVYLEDCQKKAKEYLKGLKFELNEKKTQIYPLSEGIDFLGFHYHLTDTGKALMFIRPENVKRERKKLRRLVERSRKGFLPKEKVDESYAAWRNHASKGNSFKLLQRMDAFYKSLWGYNNGSTCKEQNGSCRQGCA